MAETTKTHETEPITQLTENTGSRVQYKPVYSNAGEKPVTPTAMYGGFLVRLMAYILDFGLLLIVFIGIAIIIGTDSYNAVVATNATIFSYAGFVLYNVFFLSTWSTTPGKALYGLRIVYKDSGQKISFGTAIGRSLLQIISTFFFGIGYWNMGTDKYKQAFHDVQMKTAVLREEVNLALPIILTIIAGGAYAYFTASGS